MVFRWLHWPWLAGRYALKNSRETVQFTFGSKGLVGDYSYDTFLQHGEVDSKLVSQDVLMSRYYEALDATN